MFSNPQVAGPVGWATATGLATTIAGAGLTLSTAGLAAGQASVVVGSAWAIARSGDELIGKRVDSDGDGEGDRTLMESVIDMTTGDQSTTDKAIFAADMATIVVEIGPGIYNTNGTRERNTGTRHFVELAQ